MLNERLYFHDLEGNARHGTCLGDVRGIWWFMVGGEHVPATPTPPVGIKAAPNTAPRSALPPTKRPPLPGLPPLKAAPADTAATLADAQAKAKAVSQSQQLNQVPHLGLQPTGRDPYDLEGAAVLALTQGY